MQGPSNAFKIIKVPTEPNNGYMLLCFRCVLYTDILFLKNYNLIDNPYEFIYRITKVACRTARNIWFTLNDLRTVVICAFMIYVARCMSSSWELHYHLISHHLMRISFIFRDTILTICSSET
jgi:hypothetical protein